MMNGVSAVIWTTTPWTLPHNRALAFHPDYEYVVVETERGALLLAAERVSPCRSECGIKQARYVRVGEAAILKAPSSSIRSCQSRCRESLPIM